MVISLEEPGINDIAVTNAVIGERQGGKNRHYFNQISPNWIGRIQRYTALSGNPETIGTTIVAKADSGKYINLYSHPDENSVQKIQVLDVLRSHGLDYCPACGEDGYPRTLDHYLPKEKYPEFALLSKNLAPMCDMCQGAKLAKTINSDGEKYFIHPYYDRLDEVQLLKAIIYPPFDSGTTTHLMIRPDLRPLELKQLCQRHLEELNIADRYIPFFRRQYPRIKRLIASKRNGGILQVDELRILIDKFRELAALKSCNSWPHVFYNSILENNELVEFLASGDIGTINLLA